METERQSLGFFDKVIYSVQPAKYKELLEHTGKKIISYLLILSLCLSVMQFIIPMAGWFASFGGLDNLFHEVLPAIELQNGRLSVENKIEIGADSATYILIDTERVSMQESDLETDKYVSEILLAEENMIIYTSGMGAMDIKYADFGNVSLDNEGLGALKPFIYMVLVISFFTHMFSQLFDLVVWSCLMALCCWGPFRLRGAEDVSYKKLFALALYAQTVPKLLVAFNSCVGLIKDDFILYYVGMMVSMFLLMNGIRKIGGKPVHE